MKTNISSEIENDYHDAEVTACDYYYLNQTTDRVTTLSVCFRLNLFNIGYRLGID